MRAYLNENLKKSWMLYLLMLSVSLSFVSLGINMKSILQSKKPILIAIDLNGTRIVQEQTDPIFNTEAVNFISIFISHLYNFDSGTFVKQIGYATNLMSEDLWKAKKSEIMELRAKVDSNEIVLRSEIRKITKNESGEYFVLITTTEKSRISTQSNEVTVKISLQSTARSSDNPYGLEIRGYSENQ